MKLVKVAYAQHLPEAELLQSFLRDEGIRCMARRAAGFDVPDFLAAWPARNPRRRGRRGVGAAGARRVAAHGRRRQRRSFRRRSGA